MTARNYTYMIVRKISGLCVSRHTTEASALSSLRKKDSDRDPLELRAYSGPYWSKMGK